jgi:hypothetical protein
MTVDALVGNGRARAESLMKDTVAISTGGVLVYDDITGDLVPEAGTAVYTGKARLRQPAAAEVNRMFGGEDVTIARFILSVPHDVTGVAIDNVVQLTSTYQSDTAARHFKVVAVPAESFVIDRKFWLEAVE